MEDSKIVPRKAVRKSDLKRKVLKEIGLDQKIAKNSDENVRRKIIRKENVNPTKDTNINLPHMQESNYPLMDSKQFQNVERKPPQKSLRFENTHKRFTNYLENDLHRITQNLKNSGEIDSLTALFNNAVFEYLTRYFPDAMIKK
ncbi:hypothetical protein [Ammoniphilus resinae]|uniref:Uncharacterized protein n=1 Tax=Ammoniphilus resinae TaxID=861532 RepID=A0ABS4GQX5_9BACL|nr:hypothetical protein [Ammoniphilus resinae]MBP1932290.1 hypothetical protein [Ammoniphilus resinae]